MKVKDSPHTSIKIQDKQAILNDIYADLEEIKKLIHYIRLNLNSLNVDEKTK